jgi:hypothetical protein
VGRDATQNRPERRRHDVARLVPPTGNALLEAFERYAVDGRDENGRGDSEATPPSLLQCRDERRCEHGVREEVKRLVEVEGRRSGRVADGGGDEGGDEE